MGGSTSLALKIQNPITGITVTDAPLDHGPIKPPIMSTTRHRPSRESTSISLLLLTEAQSTDGTLRYFTEATEWSTSNPIRNPPGIRAIYDEARRCSRYVLMTEW